VVRNTISRQKAQIRTGTSLRTPQARVFLEPQAASLLGDKVLDASIEENQVAFTIVDQVEE
jgi:hypothetical protein